MIRALELTEDGFATVAIGNALLFRCIFGVIGACYFLDVRTPEEFAEGHIGGAMLLPCDQVEQKAGRMLPEKDKPIIVYCRSGRRGAIAAENLRGLGDKDVKDCGGISRWQGELER